MLEALEEGVKGGVWFSLVDKVYRMSTLLGGWLEVKKNKGGAGSDHQTIEDFEQGLEENLKRLQEELRTGRYWPRPIKRKYIEKAGRRERRPLGIPAVRDRVGQAALNLVMGPIFERVFLEHNYGFRPGRGCKDALREVERLLKAGYTWVVDIDLKEYFDSIPHEGLMEELRRFIADGGILRLIESYLKQDILEDLAQWTPEKGTPQGAVISPLLANLYLHPVDEEMARAGYEMIRYADDIVIMCQSEEEAEAAMEKVKEQAQKRGLTVHLEKTQIVDVREAGKGFDFLGYHFEGKTRWPRKKSLKKFKGRIRQKTTRSSGQSMGMIIADVNGTLRGWFEYFKHSNQWTFSRLDGWIRRRLRSILRRRRKLKGVSRGRDHQRWPNPYFRELGLFSLEEAHRNLLQSS